MSASATQSGHNKAICALAAIESHVLLSSAIFVRIFSIHQHTRAFTTRRRAVPCVVLRCVAPRRVGALRSGVNAALV